MSSKTNLPPELTARIEKDIRRAIAKHTYPSLGGPVTEVEDAMRDLAEPLHKEIEELRTENKAARSAENEWRETIQELRKEREFFEANSVHYQRQSDALEAQLADTEASRQEYIRLFHEQERENDELEKKYSAVSSAYNELIMAVGRKFPGEIRHDTALRYIKRAEELSDAGPACQPNQEPS